MQIPSTAEILIVGAGPTGLALAAELRRRNVDAFIVDKQAEGANTSRAAVVHARTLEVLEPLGVVPDMRDSGLIVPIFRARDRDRALLEIDFRHLETRYAFTLMCPAEPDGSHPVGASEGAWRQGRQTVPAYRPRSQVRRRRRSHHDA